MNKSLLPPCHWSAGNQNLLRTNIGKKSRVSNTLKSFLILFVATFSSFSAFAQPTVAAPDPSCDPGDVISLFSNVYTDVPVDTWLTVWSNANLADIQIAGNDTKEYTNVDFLGIETVGPNVIDASTMSNFHLDIYTPNMTTFRVKLVDFGADGAFGGGDDSEHEIAFDNPAQNEWISYDIPLADFTGLASTEHIAQYILSGIPPGGGTVYVDNVYFSNNNCVTAAPAPTEPAANVISLFSNVYTDVPVDTWLTVWSSAALEDIQISGNDTKKYTNIDFLGIETVGPNVIDATAMTNFHMDVWTPNMTTFRIKLVDFGADGVFGGGDDSEHEIAFDSPAQNEWVSYDIPLSDFVGLNSTAHMAQYILSGIPIGGGTAYVDNVYFSQATTADIELCVDMSCFPGVQAPSVFGAFNGWNAGANPITDPDGDGFYCATVTMSPGAQQYKFFDQIQGPENFTTLGACNALDGVNINRVIDVVAGMDQSVMFGWNTCDPTCIPPPVPNVELCVDMTCLPGVQAPSVFGAFNGWNAGANPVTDPDGDGIYCATVLMSPGDQQFKFFDQIQGPEEFATVGTCNALDGPNINRFVTVTGMPQSFTFGWESCDLTCVPPPPPADLPITFEDPGINYDLIDFGGASSTIAVDPTDPTNMVICTNKTQGAATFAGTVIGNSGLLNPIPFTATDTKLTVRVWSPIANTPVLLKLENSAGGPTTEVLVNTTASMTWETLVFDFSNDPAFNVANTYNKVVIFFNFGSIGANRIYYFDDIMLCMPGAVALTCPPVGAATGCMAADVTPFADFAAFEAAGGSAEEADPNSFMLINTTESGTCPVTVVHTYQIADICGTNTVTCDHITLVEAPSGPIVTCPADQVVSCFEDIVVDPNDLVVTTSCGSTFTAYVKQPLITGGLPGCDGTIYTYIYKAVDECGRVGECEQQFLIQNNAPTLTVPAGQTVSCFEDIEVSAADVTVMSDCAGDNTINVLGPVVSGPANCPGTTYTYTYRVKDFCNRIVEEDRVFTIGTNSGPIITAIPLNFISECEAGPSLQQFTAVSGCGGAVETSVSDPVVIGTPGCSGTRVQYTYTATDACGRTASHTQIITLINDNPVVHCPETLQIFGCEDGDTDELIDAWIASVTATASCEGSVTMNNNYNGNAGVCINNGFTNVTFSATDQCGRTSTCVGTIIIIDTDAPVIYQAPQEVLVPCNGVTQDIFNNWLSTQGGAEAIDGCWGNNISWSTNPSNPQLNCAAGPQAIVVEFIARDGCGNTSSITGIFNTKVQPTMVNVSGQILREDTEPVADVQMAISGGTSGIPDMDYTENGGAYGFPELEYEDNLVLSPEKNDDPLNGVSTYDLILLKKHILLVDELDSPYKRIAADVNRSGSISTFDLLLLRRLILFVDTEFTSNTSWRFVEADFLFPNVDNPFETTFPEAFNLTGLEEEYADFVGVKIGDLDLSSIANGFAGVIDDRSNLDDLTFEVKDQHLKSGEEYRIDFTAQNFEAINGFQFTLNFDPTAVEATSMGGANLSHFNENNYGLSKADNGAITVSWNADAYTNLKSDEVAFSLIITAKTDVQLSDVLSISSEFTRAEAYQRDELMNVNLAFNNNGVIVATEAFKLFQNQPNPFKESTTIGFNLPEGGAVSLKIYDVSGRLIHTQEGEFAKGYNQMDLDRANLPGGVLYYHVNTATDSDAKKMILLD